MSGVIPNPPARFSPLTTTNDGLWRSRSAGSVRSSAWRPAEPTRSPQNRMRADADTLAILPQMSTEEHVAVVDEQGGELPPAPPAPLIVPRGVQLVLLLVALLALWV